MPLVTDAQQAREVYQEAAERGVALPAFCMEDRETLEAILAAGLEMSQRLGIPGAIRTGHSCPWSRPRAMRCWGRG